MKLPYSSTILLLCSAIGLAQTTTSNVSAKDISIAVVDMQKALNNYNRTGIEVEKINAFHKGKADALQEKGEIAKQISEKAKAARREAGDTALNQQAREQKAEMYRSLMRELSAVSKELAAAEHKTSQELLKVRQEMEAALVEDIKTVMRQIAASEGIDLILDRSFLPKANKVILFQSGNVNDLTDRILRILNAEN